LYIPLYDYYKKVPVSFIFLSAGVDGKMDNEIAPSDTLYLNNWWAKLDVYNYEEAILLQDFCERWDETSNVGKSSVSCPLKPSDSAPLC
jgi:hypothetical protein